MNAGHVVGETVIAIVCPVRNLHFPSSQWKRNQINHR